MLRFLFWNVQHGSAAFISTPNKCSIVADLGTGIVGEDRLLSPISVLRANGYLEQLHLLILTHPHYDHLADIHSLSGIPVRNLIAPRVPLELLDSVCANDPTIIDQYRRLLDSFEYKLPFELGKDRTDDWDGAKLTPFFPTCDTANVNNCSVVVLCEYAGAKLLLTGDNEEASWKNLLDDKRFRKAVADVDIFVAPHHGRSSGFYPPLFDIMRPKLTVISDGTCQETSITEIYANVSSGMTVDLGGTKQKRKCVTTRRDGSILIEFHNGLFSTIRVRTECPVERSERKIRIL